MSTYLLWGGIAHGKVVECQSDRLTLPVRDMVTPLRAFAERREDPMRGLGKWQRRAAKWFKLDERMEHLASTIPQPTYSQATYHANRHVRGHEMFHLMFQDFETPKLDAVDLNYIRQKFPQVVSRNPFPPPGIHENEILRSQAR